MKNRQSRRDRRRRQEPVVQLESRRLLSTTGAPLHWLVDTLMSSPMRKVVASQQHGTAKGTKVTQGGGAKNGGSAAQGASGLAAEAAAGAAVPNSSAGSLSSAGLAGRVVYTSGGHGFVWRDSSSSWGVMRGYLNNMMEDLGNQDQLEPFANHLLQAGATVVSMRPVGHQTNEVIVDNASTYSAANGGFQVISGTWTNMTDGPYWSNKSDGNDAVHYVTAATAASETAVVRFTPKITAAGFYPVYAWYNPGANSSSNDRVADQTFRINYAGGSREVKVAANKTGKGWVYLGDYYFEAGVNGASGSVEVSNKSATTGKKVVADAIRFGNGMGDVNYSYSYSGGNPVLKTFSVSGQPREDECALYWCYASRGWSSPNNRVAPSVVYSGSSTDDETKNFSACDAYAAYMNQGSVGSNRDRVWISFHTNAGGGRGTVGLITGSATTNQAELALIAGRTVQNVMQGLNATHEYNWSMKTTPTYTGAYGEISTGYIGSEFDATIIEVAYHDDATDAAMLKDPTVRNDVGKAAYHTAVQYFKAFGSLTNTTYLPEPPTDVRAVTDASGNVTVLWNPGPSSPVMAGYDPLGTDNVNSTADNPGPYGNDATGYKVYTSTNGYGFDGGVTVTGATSLTFTGLSTTAPTYFKVVAFNAGGESLGSYVVVAKPQASGRAPLLIVNGYTRLDDDGDQIDTKYFGTAARARWRYNNTFDYVVQAASSVSSYSALLGIESAPASAVAAGLINLADYQTVIWMSGEQSTTHGGTFRGATVTAVSNYLAGGGKLLLSGSEIAWDLSAKGNGTSFFTNTLHATYVADDALTYNFNAGVAGTALASVPAGSFDNGTHGTYDVDYADVLGAGSGAQVAMYYSGGTKGAAIQWAGANNARLLYLGFPIESIYTQSTRNALVSAALTYFGVVDAPGMPDLADVSDLGPYNYDNITNRNNSAGKTLQFTVPGTVPGALVQVFANGTLIGQATATATSTTVITNGTVPLVSGTYAITAVQTASGASAPSAASNALSVTIDTAAPAATFSAISTPRSGPVPSVGVTFSEQVYGLDPADLVLRRDGIAIPYTPSQTLSVAGNIYTLTNLAALTNKAGTYSASISNSSSGVTDLAGNSLSASPSVSWVVNVINGAPGADSFVLARNAFDPATLDVTVNGSTYTVGLAGIGQVSLVGFGPADSVILDLSAGTPVFDVGAGLTLNIDPASSLTINGTSGDDSFSLSATGGTLNGLALTLVNAPVDLVVSGTTGNDTLTLTGRGVTFATDAALTTDHLTLNLGTGATATFAASQHLAALNLSGDAIATLVAGGDRVLVTGALSIAGAAKLDLTDNDMVVTDGMSPDQVRQLLAGGGLFSSTAMANPLHTTALGYALAGEVGLSAFSSEPVLGSALLVKYTYLGDTDLDGRVTVDDLARVDRGRAKNLATWLAGDLNYDAAVDAADLSLAYTAFRDQGLPL